MERPKDWITAGGVLGIAILTARLTKTPLAGILSAMPFLLKELRKLEAQLSQSKGAASGPMTRQEAALILGISENADERAIAEAHHRLIQKNHPDVGGTDYLAAKINQARDILLKQ